jgi:hypothetical protein
MKREPQLVLLAVFSDNLYMRSWTIAPVEQMLLFPLAQYAKERKARSSRKNLLTSPQISEDDRAMWCNLYTPSLFAPPPGASPAELKRYLDAADPIVRQVVSVLCGLVANRGELDVAADGLLTLYVRTRGCM